MTASDARASLPELLNRVEQGEEITIIRHGRVAAVLVHPDLLRSRRVDALQEDVDRVRELFTPEPPAGHPAPAGMTAERAEELVAEVRLAREPR